jgi:hypothetical protein
MKLEEYEEVISQRMRELNPEKCLFGNLQPDDIFFFDEESLNTYDCFRVTYAKHPNCNACFGVTLAANSANSQPYGGTFRSNTKVWRAEEIRNGAGFVKYRKIINEDTSK